MTSASQNLWQITVESGVETGQPPLLDLGVSPGILPSLTTLLALTAFAGDRLDTTTPQVVLGGESSSWLLALLVTPHTAPLPQTPPLTIIYGGVDQATQIAAIGVYQDQTSIVSRQQQRDLPRSFAAWFAPSQQSGVGGWAVWPFGFWQTDAIPQQNTADRWLAWTGLLLGLGLLLAALFA